MILQLKKMDFTRNQFLLVVVICVIVLKIIFAEIYFKKGAVYLNGYQPQTSQVEKLKRNLFLSELKLMERRIERDILSRELNKFIGQKELETYVGENGFNSFLSDDGIAALYQIYVEEGGDLSEEGLRRFFALLKENKGLLLQSKRPVSALVSEDGSLPFVNTLDQKRQANTPLYISKATISDGASLLSLMEEPLVSVVEFRGADPFGVQGGLIATFIKEAIKTIFDIMALILMNKELFLILGIFMALVIGFIVLYSMHFR